MNLIPTLQTKRCDTFLSLIAPKALTSKVLFDVFREIRETLYRLYSVGFKVKIREETHQVYARVVALSGDNLWVNTIYGLSSQFTSGTLLYFTFIYFYLF